MNNCQRPLSPLDFSKCVFACPICHDLIGVGTQEVKALLCGHTFHGKCILTWLQSASTCPVCRATSTPDSVVTLFFDIKEIDYGENSMFNNIVENLEFELKMQRSSANNLGQQLKVHKQQNSSLREELSQSQKSYRELCSFHEIEKKRIQSKLEKYESCRKILSGSFEDVEEECRKGILSPEQLIVCLKVFRKILKTTRTTISGVNITYDNTYDTMSDVDSNEEDLNILEPVVVDPLDVELLSVCPLSMNPVSFLYGRPNNLAGAQNNQVEKRDVTPSTSKTPTTSATPTSLEVIIIDDEDDDEEDVTPILLGPSTSSNKRCLSLPLPAPKMVRNIKKELKMNTKVPPNDHSSTSSGRHVVNNIQQMEQSDQSLSDDD